MNKKAFTLTTRILREKLNNCSRSCIYNYIHRNQFIENKHYIHEKRPDKSGSYFRFNWSTIESEPFITELLKRTTSDIDTKLRHAYRTFFRSLLAMKLQETKSQMIITQEGVDELLTLHDSRVLENVVKGRRDDCIIYGMDAAAAYYYRCRPGEKHYEDVLKTNRQKFSKILQSIPAVLNPIIPVTKSRRQICFDRLKLRFLRDCIIIGFSDIAGHLNGASRFKMRSFIKRKRCPAYTYNDDLIAIQDELLTWQAALPPDHKAYTETNEAIALLRSKMHKMTDQNPVMAILNILTSNMNELVNQYPIPELLPAWKKLEQGSRRTLDKDHRRRVRLKRSLRLLS